MLAIDQETRAPITFRLNAALPLAVLVISIGIYLFARAALTLALRHPPLPAFLLVAATATLAVLVSGTRYQDFPRFLTILVRGIGAVVAVLILFDNIGVTEGPPNLLFGAGDLFFRYGALIALITAGLAFWRPSFQLPGMVYYILFRHLIGISSGIPVSDTDYRSMLDIGLFATIGGLLLVWLTSPADLPARWRSWLRFEPGEVLSLRRQAGILIWAGGLGAHLGNYFFSAFAKLLAGGMQPWSWILHNETQRSILIGLERGDNLLGSWPALAQSSWDAIAGFTLLFNLLVFSAQFLAPLAILRKRYILAITLFFDLFHIGVFLTLGALFYNWIAVNILIYASLFYISDRDLTPLVRTVAVATLLLGQNAFHMSWLGWFDGTRLASPYFVAETTDGRRVAVPDGYFGIFAYTIGQGALYVPDDQFTFSIGGNQPNYERAKAANACMPEFATRQHTGVTLEAVEGIVRNTDEFMRAHPLFKADNLYYLYPHHLMPNPFLFRDFNALKIGDIARYHYVVDSVCLSLKDGILQRDVKASRDYVFDVQ